MMESERQRNSNRINVNRLWGYLILIYIFISALAVLANVIPHFVLICTEVVWIAVCAFYYLRRKWKGWILVLIVGIIGLGLLYKVLPQSYEANFLASGLVLAFVFCYAERQGISVMEYCHIRRMRLASVPVAVAAGLTAYVTAGFLNVVSELFAHNFVKTRFLMEPENFLINFLVFAFVPAIVEEITYRGVIFRGIEAPKKALVISALMFGLMHMNLNQISYAFLMGIVFGLILLITDNLLVTIIVHMTFNGFTLCLASFQESPVTQFFARLNVAGYHIYAPEIKAANGEIQVKLVIAGVICCLLALILTLMLAWLVRKLEGTALPAGSAADGEPEAGTWRPTGSFYIACALCILIAVATEFAA